MEMTTLSELYECFVKGYEHLIHVKLPACSKASGTLIDTTISLINLDGFELKMFTGQAKEFVKLSSEIGSNNYPEVMFKMFIVNASWVFRGVWAMIKPFLEMTVSKISIHGSSYQESLFEFVSPDNVPKFLGGNCQCEGGCLETEEGPWDHYEADEVGEFAKE